MRKSGEGNLPPKRPSLEGYEKELDTICSKALRALEQYEAASDMKQREHLKRVMDEQMSLIHDVAKEVKRSGAHTQAAKVEKDYNNYLKGIGDDAYAALEHDLVTLKDYAFNPKRGEGGERNNLHP